MALLQISEPGASPDPHARRHAVGIDLGTTHSLVAAVRSGVAECLPDRDGEVILPSVVRYLADGRARVGREALAGAVSDPTNTIVSVKRLMGRGLADVSSGGRLSYDFVEADEGMVRVRTAAGVVGQALGDAVAHRRHQRMRRAEVDADRDAALMRVGRTTRFGDLQQDHPLIVPVRPDADRRHGQSVR